MFNKNLQADIIDDHTAHDHNQIPEKLYPPFEKGSLEDHVHAQVKSDWESNDEGNKECCYVRLECNKPEIEHLFVQNIIIGNKIDQQAQRRIGTTAGCIMIGLQRHEPFYQRIEYIQHGENAFPDLMMDPLHGCC